MSVTVTGGGAVVVVLPEAAWVKRLVEDLVIAISRASAEWDAERRASQGRHGRHGWPGEP